MDMPNLRPASPMGCSKVNHLLPGLVPWIASRYATSRKALLDLIFARKRWSRLSADAYTSERTRN